MEGERTPVFTYDELRCLSTEIFEAVGVSKKEAKLVTDMLVKSNLVGMDSHGVQQIPSYVENILKGICKPGSKIDIVKETSTTAVVNGNRGLGQVVATESMNIAIKKAQKYNIGIVTTFNCNHIGRMADYALMAPPHNMIGYCCVTDKPALAPYGGAERMLNPSPFCWAIPAGKENPFMLDISASVCAIGKILVARDMGKKLPLGWIIDKDGKPTTDPEDYFNGGAVLPFGGQVAYKGYGIAMVVDILAGLLSGRGPAYDQSRRESLPPGSDQGIFQMALKISSFQPIGEFKSEMVNLIKALKNSKTAYGFKEILIPGEIEIKNEKIRLKEGINIPTKTWNKIIKTAKNLKINVNSFI